VTSNELGFDRLFAVCETRAAGPLNELARSLGFEEEGGDAVYLSGYRSGLRTIAIFAFIHQPIWPLSRVAFLAHWVSA